MKGVPSDPYRVSVSSAPSSSSQGSLQDDLDSLGDIYMWGEGIGDGLLGGGAHKVGDIISAKVDALLPKLLNPALVIDVQQIACGGKHAALVTRQGEVFSWGEESGGRLGHGINCDIPYPQLVEALSSNSVESVTCGEYHTCAVTMSGDLFTWGDGRRNSGILGSDNDISFWVPKKVYGSLEGVRVTSVACGPWHTVIVSSSGQLFTYGDGTFGVLGHGDQNSVFSPREVESLKGLRATSAACGVWHTAAIIEVMVGHSSSSNSSSGKLFTWGDGDKGRLGHEDKDARLVPTCVSALIDYNFRQVACGHTMTAALTTSGHIFTMGSTVYGQLGNPRAGGKFPIRVEGNLWEAAVQEIACGAYHVAALTSKLEVYTWGKGANGRLGHGDVEDRNFPTLVDALKDKQVKSIACGTNFTGAVCLRKWFSGTEQSLCANCRLPFGFTRKRHNCYNCGLVFCHSCSSKKSYRASMAPTTNKPYRVCDSCYVKIKNVHGPAMTSLSTATKKRHSEIKEKAERYDGRFLVPQLAMSIMPSLQFDVRAPVRRGKKSDLSSSRVAPVPVGLLPWSDTSTLTPFDTSLFDLPKTTMPQLALLPPTKDSRHLSPFSRRPTPARSTTPTPTVRGLTSPKIPDLKKTNETFSQEIFKLQKEVQNLTLQNERLRLEQQRLERRAQDAIVMAAQEAAKCNAAKEVIKSLTAQLKDIAERAPSGACHNEISSRYQLQPPNGLYNPLDPVNQSVKVIDNNADVTLQTKREHADIRMSKHVSGFANAEDLSFEGIVQPQKAFSAALQGSNKMSVREHGAVLLPEITKTSGDIHKFSEAEQGTSGSGNVVLDSVRDSDSEWVEQDEPGVYITLKALPDGSKDLKRVRFSRKKFTERQAEIWWAENKTRVLERYDIRSFDRKVSSLSTRKEDHDNELTSHSTPDYYTRPTSNSPSDTQERLL